MQVLQRAQRWPERLDGSPKAKPSMYQLLSPVDFGSREQESSCPPLGVGDLEGSPSNAKAAISPNRAAIARRAEPRESHASPDPPGGSRRSHSPPSTAATSNPESRLHHRKSRPPMSSMLRRQRRRHARRRRRAPTTRRGSSRPTPRAPSPTPHPTPTPPTPTYAPSASCADDATWSYGTKASNTCAYVARKLKRCKAKNTDGFRNALEACPKTCGTC